MKYIHLFSVVALGWICAACTNIENSRDLSDPAVSGSTLARQVCSLCHGVDGQSISPNSPNLAAQQPSYFIGQMQGFRSHRRMDPAGFEYMWGLSRSLTDEQIKALADYYAAQTPAAPGAIKDPAAVARGKVIYEKGVPEKNIAACLSCHGPQAEGNAQSPRLANQHADYLVKQLEIFKKTDERPEGGVMKTVSHDLTTQSMVEVAAYLQAMPAPP